MRALSIIPQAGGHNRLKSGILITLPLLQLEGFGRPSLFHSVEEPEVPEMPEVRIPVYKEDVIKRLQTEIRRAQELIFDGRAQCDEKTLAVLRPLKYISDAVENKLFTRACNGADIRDLFPEVPAEEVETKWRLHVAALEDDLNTYKKEILKIVNGDRLDDFTCVLLFGCISAKLTKLGHRGEIPMDWVDCFHFLAEHVPLFIPEAPLYGLRVIVKRTLDQLALYRQGGRPHWLDVTATRKQRKTAALLSDLATKALGNIADVAVVKGKKESEKALQNLKVDCTRFLDGVRKLDLKSVSEETRLTGARIIRDYCDGLDRALDGDLVTVKEFKEDFFKFHDSYVIRRREIEVFGCTSEFLDTALELCLSSTSDHELASSRRRGIEENLKVFFAHYSAFLCGQGRSDGTPEELYEYTLALTKTIKACIRLEIRQKAIHQEEEMVVVEEGEVGGEEKDDEMTRPFEGGGGVYSSGVFTLGGRGQGSSSSTNSQSGSFLSSVTDDRYLHYLISQFNHWTRSCVLDKNSEVPEEIAKYHSDTLERKWGHLELGQKNHAALLQDLVTEMATILPNLEEDELNSLNNPGSDGTHWSMAYYSYCARAMTITGHWLIEEWCRDGVSGGITAKDCFCEVASRILGDTRTDDHLKLAQIMRLWRIFETSNTIQEVDRDWIQTWEEMEVVEYALFENANEFTPKTIHEGLRIVQRLLYPIN